jgi:chemotaxis protein CheX
VAVKVEYLNPFVTAAAEVMRSETELEVRRGALSLQQSPSTADDVNTLLSMVGDVHGTVMYSMPLSMALALVTRMMGEPFEEMDELAQSGIAELGNVITGRAATKLSQTGIAVDLSVPTLILGKGATISTLDFQRLVVPLETDLGTMQIHLALRPR